jgi:RND family efflux transporter MFP subunit
LTQVHADDDDAAAANATAQVQVAPVKRGTLPRTLMVFGSVQSSTATHQAVEAPVAARIAEIQIRLGEKVAKDAPLMTLEPTPTTMVAYAQAKSALKLATDQFARTRTLVDQHLATAQQLGDAEKAENDARAALQALEAQGAAGPTIVRAPYAATVTALTTSVGSIVDVGGPLLELARPSALVLAAGAVPLSARQVANGNKASVTPLGGGDPVNGKVSLRGAAVDPASGLVPVEITLSNDSLYPGETASAQIITGQLSGFVVPHTAVLLNDEGETYVVQDVNGVAKKVPVKVLGRDDDQDVVDGKLAEDAPLVLSGNYQVDDGMKVQIAEPKAKEDKDDDKADKDEKADKDDKTDKTEDKADKDEKADKDDKDDKDDDKAKGGDKP